MPCSPSRFHSLSTAIASDRNTLNHLSRAVRFKLWKFSICLRQKEKEIVSTPPEKAGCSPPVLAFAGFSLPKMECSEEEEDLPASPVPSSRGESAGRSPHLPEPSGHARSAQDTDLNGCHFCSPLHGPSHRLFQHI